MLWCQTRSSIELKCTPRSHFTLRTFSDISFHSVSSKFRYIIHPTSQHHSSRRLAWPINQVRYPRGMTSSYFYFVGRCALVVVSYFARLRAPGNTLYVCRCHVVLLSGFALFCSPPVRFCCFVLFPYRCIIVRVVIFYPSRRLVRRCL